MAFIGQNWMLNTVWIDTGGKTTSRRFELVATDDDGDLTAVIADVQTIVAAWIAASNAVLVSQTISKTSVEDSVTLPAGNVNIEENLQVSAKIFGTPNKSAVFEIPAPKDTLFEGATGEAHDIADFDDTVLAAAVAVFVNGEQAYISDGETITVQNIRGKRVHHKSTKG